MFRNYRFILVLLVFNTTFMSCNSQSESEIHQWESRYHKVNVKYSDQWTEISSSSSKDKTIFGLIDKTDGASIVIKISKDISKDLLSDSTYHDAVANQMLNANLANRLINEADVNFHGELYHRQAFIMHTKKWGQLHQHVYTRRTGNWAYSIQISWPSSEKELESLGLPKDLEELNQNILINGK